MGELSLPKTTLDLQSLPSPGLLVFPERIQNNINRMLTKVGGDPARLRPHVKTHKMTEVVRMQVASGITQFKCATLSEARMTAQAGGLNILLAYPQVGPNVAGFLELQNEFPDIQFSTLVDNPLTLQAFTDSKQPVSLFVDIDCGMGRTGIAPGPEAIQLCQTIHASSQLRFAGFHIYDGHIHQTDLAERTEAFETSLSSWQPMINQLEESGIQPPTIVTGGSPTFELFSQHTWQCSPGTTLLWDAGYSNAHADLDFEVAALLLTRVVSRPGRDRICLDLGYKAVAAENPLACRVVFPDLPDAKPISQSEEHLVMETHSAQNLPPGTPLLGIPWHICPTVALHARAHIIREDAATDEIWAVDARDR